MGVSLDKEGKTERIEKSNKKGKEMEKKIEISNEEEKIDKVYKKKKCKCGTENSIKKLEKKDSKENIKINSFIKPNEINEINNIKNESIAKSEIISKENNNYQIKNEIPCFDNISIQKNEDLIKINDKNNLHYITGHKITLDKEPIAQKENNINNVIMENNSQIQIEIKFPYEKDIPNKIMNIKGNFTVDELEKKFIDEKFVFDRGISIRDIKKPLIELQKNQSTFSFSLMKKGDKLIKDLIECEINYKNIDYKSCYQSSTLQGFVHIILPISIKNINRLREEKGLGKIEDLDELKNDSIFNNNSY